MIKISKLHESDIYPTMTTCQENWFVRASWEIIISLKVSSHLRLDIALDLMQIAIK